jgi:hypothetical protein
MSSCDKSNSPINISKNSVSGPCDNKCNLIFNYHDSTCNILRESKYLELSYDQSSKSPVKFNSTPQDVYKLRLYCPSVHKFNDKTAVAELIISHNGNGSNLLICIPLMSSDITSECSKLMDKIIQGTERLAPKVGNQTTLNISDYNFNNIVPRLPYFFYEASLPYEPCNGNYNIVVFHTNTFNTIKKPTLDKLKNMINPHNIKIKSGPDLFLSGSKAKSNDDNNDIYISCQPVNKSKKEGFTNINDSYLTSISDTKTLDTIHENIVPIFIGSAFLFGLMYYRKK